jgi:hypothetical protein
MEIKPFAIAAGVVGAVVLTGCNAHADPPTFPDISRYTPVDPKDYALQSENSGRPYPLTMTYFLTPDGVICDFLPAQAQCIGNNLPAIPPASPTANGTARVNWIGTATKLQPTVQSDHNSSGAKTLPPLHSITVNGVICGVDDSGLTACKDSQGRGFVLSPHGSGWLPHV